MILICTLQKVMTNIWVCLSISCSFQFAMVQIRVNIHFYIILVNSCQGSEELLFRPMIWITDFMKSFCLNDYPSYSFASSSLYQSSPRRDLPSQSLHRLKLITAPVFWAWIHCGLGCLIVKTWKICSDFSRRVSVWRVLRFSVNYERLGECWVSFWQF